MIFNSVIVGGGPAGLAPLVSASRSGSLDEILAAGVAIVERGPTIGTGAIGDFAINTDSSAETIVSCVRDNSGPLAVQLRDHPTTVAVAAYGRGAAPLRLVGEFLAEVGEVLRSLVAAAPQSCLLPGHEAVHTRRTDDGLWQTLVRRTSDGVVRSVLSRQVVLATGAHQPETRLARQTVSGAALMPRYADKLMQSGVALTAAGLETIGRRMEAGGSRRVAIVGSSSSAMACAHALLQTGYGRDFSEGAVTVLHRRPLRVFHPSAAAALAEGYDEFGPNDICPISGFVFRFAGFRLESRELAMAARGIGGRPPEPRLRLHRLVRTPDPVALGILDEAAAIVVALGYRPRALPVLSAAGDPVALLAHGSGDGPLVDSQCRVLDAAGDPVAGLLGIGLAAGFVSREASGGEPSFSGQTNSLWQWQNDIGAIVAERMRRPWPVAADRNADETHRHPNASRPDGGRCLMLTPGEQLIEAGCRVVSDTAHGIGEPTAQW